METITVDAAIKRGRWLLFWIPIFVFFGAGGLFACVFLYVNDGEVIWINAVGTFATLLLPMIVMLLYYFIMLPRWRIWAFSNVRNIHELKQRAILGQIYPKDNSFIWRFEIKSAAQKEALRDIETRFQQSDVFDDDYLIPGQTSYSYPKSDKIIFMVFAVLCLAGVVFMFDIKQIFTDIVMVLGFVMFSVLAYKRATAEKTQLTISNDGVATPKNGFHSWADIQNEQVLLVSAGRSSQYVLSYEVNGEVIKISLSDLTGLKSYNVDHTLRTYRGRYEASKSRNTKKSP